MQIDTNTYVVYDKEGLPCMIGNKKDVLKYLDVTDGTFKSQMSRFKKGTRKNVCRGYKVYVVEDEKCS